MQDKILTQPAKLTAWLLERNPSTVSEVLSNSDNIQNLATELGRADVDQIGLEYAKVAVMFLSKLESPALHDLANGFKKLLLSYERHDLVGRLPNLPEEPPTLETDGHTHDNDNTRHQDR